MTAPCTGAAANSATPVKTTTARSFTAKTSSGSKPGLAGCGCLFQNFSAFSPIQPTIASWTGLLKALTPPQPAKVEPSAGNIEVTPAIAKQLLVPLPS